MTAIGIAATPVPPTARDISGFKSFPQRFRHTRPLERQRMIFAALAELMTTDIHALSISAQPPTSRGFPQQRTSNMNQLHAHTSLLFAVALGRAAAPSRSPRINPRRTHSETQPWRPSTASPSTPPSLMPTRNARLQKPAVDLSDNEREGTPRRK